MLQTADVEQLVDVRSVPGSRRHPQFARDALARSLPEHGIGYVHEPALGGFRKPRANSPNTGWQHEGFRGYADYMATEGFREALARLERQGSEQPTSVMCAELQWWRCHRRLIADALTVSGWTVLHLGLGPQPVEHELTPFAAVGPGDALTYPPAQADLGL